MKKRNPPLIILSIIALFLVLFFSFPSVSYPIFPQVPISLRRAGVFSKGGLQEVDQFLPEEMVLGTKNLPIPYPIPYRLVVDQAPLLDSEACQEKLSFWLSNQEGRWGVVVYDLIRNEKFSFRSEDKFHVASVMKLATAVSVFDWMKENKKELEFSFGGMSLKEKLTLMVNRSDNNQWADLGALASLARTQKILEENGLRNSNIYTNTMTAEDVFLLLGKIYERKLADKKDQEFLFRVMQNTINENRIPAGVPKEVIVAHKYGTWQGNVHDAGFVFAKTPYILVVLTNSVPQAETKIADFSSQVYQIFSQGSCERNEFP